MWVYVFGIAANLIYEQPLQHTPAIQLALGAGVVDCLCHWESLSKTNLSGAAVDGLFLL